MNRKHKNLALLGALLMVVLLAGQALAAGAEDAPDTVSECRYYYQLVSQPGASRYISEFALYVERTDENGELLHGGSIALAATTPGELTFEPEAGWQLTSKAGAVASGDMDGPETGTLDDGRKYICFGWLWNSSAGTTPPLSDSVDSGDASRQKIGTLRVPREGLPAEAVELLPWPETPTGSRQVGDWQSETAAGDPDGPAMEILKSTWRMEDPSMPAQGYYQGYYVYEDPDGEDGIKNVDLIPRWQGFVLGAYAPQRPVTLSFYQAGTDPENLVATASVSFGGGIGYFRSRIDFSALQLKSPTDTDMPELPDGTYTMVLEKPSHVKATFTGLTKTADAYFPELMGMSVILPCGDVDGNGFIGQKDRALLTQPEQYRTVYGEPHEPDREPLDLDGDHRSDQKDLAILIAPANYGKEDLTFDY